MQLVINIKSVKENGKTKSYLPPKPRSEQKSSSNRRKLIAQALNAVEKESDKEKRTTSWSHLTMEFPPTRSGPYSSQTNDDWGNMEYDLFEADNDFKGIYSVQSSRTSLMVGSGNCSRKKKPSKRLTRKESSGRKRL
jgi:hypothetical protein